ncbi:MAG: glycosyltransferase family 2 protein [Myxococcota bacterium]
MDLVVVVLNYKTPELVVDCLGSLAPQVDGVRRSVVVVDNDSRDGSVEIIGSAIDQRGWSHWARLVPSPVNGGFAAGNNLGIQAADADNYLLLNSDTIVRPGALDEILHAAAVRPEAGLIGPRLEWPDETPQISAFRFPSPFSEVIHSAETSLVTRALSGFDVPIPVSDAPIEADWVSFACVLIRSSVVHRIGLLDDNYFMYYEDIDFCRRARDAGFHIVYWPDARVVHLRGGSGDVKSSIAQKKRPRRYLYESRSRYFAKFYGGVPGVLAANLGWYTGRSVSKLRELVGNKKNHLCEKESTDIWTDWLRPLGSRQAQ